MQCYSKRIKTGEIEDAHLGRFQLRAADARFTHNAPPGSPMNTRLLNSARVIVTSPAIASQKPGSEFAVSERDSHVLHTNVQIQRPPNARTTPKVFTLNMGQVVPYVPNVLSFTDTSSSLNTQLYKTNDENQEPWGHTPYKDIIHTSKHEVKAGNIGLTSTSEVQLQLLSPDHIDSQDLIDLVSQYENTQPSKPTIKQQASVNSRPKRKKKNPGAMALLAQTATYENWWHLPPVVSVVYRSRGVTNFYDWQLECLNDKDLLRGDSLIVAAPTSGGKTIIAEITMLRCCCLMQKKCLFVLPYVTLVMQKTHELKEFGKKLNITVEGYYSTQGLMPLPHTNQFMCVATPEKANGIINHLIEENRLQELGLIVVDEIHMIGNMERGYLLELLISKVLSATSTRKGIQIQILGMSATLPNVQELASWMGGKHFQSNFRPVRLAEFYKHGQQIFNKEGQLTKTLTKTSLAGQILEICGQTIPDNGVLIFCPSKFKTEELAYQLSAYCANNFRPSSTLLARRELLLRQLTAITNRGPEFALAIKYGIAFHHSSLETRERQLIEHAFLQHTLCIICCTSTLAAGVNLPAAKVIILSTYMGMRELDVSEYRQMAGRAGRAGLASEGESYLFLDNKTLEKGKALITGELGNITSSLGSSKEAFYRLILECLGCKLGKSISGIKRFIMKTLMARRLSQSCIDEMLNACISEMLQQGFIEIQQTEPSSMLSEPSSTTETDEYSSTDSGVINNAEYQLTPFGLATYNAHYTVAEALAVRRDFSRAMRNLNLFEPLHLLFLITPPFNLPHIYKESQWQKCANRLQELNDSEMDVMNRVGVSIAYVIQQTECTAKRQTNDEQYRVTLRFICAVMLKRIIEEEPISVVAQQFGFASGDVELLHQQAALSSSTAVAFCKHMGWDAMESLLVAIARRIGFQVKPEVLPLCEIKGVKARRARALFNAGYRTVRQIANAKPEELAQVNLGKEELRPRIARMLIMNAKKLLEQTAANHHKIAHELQQELQNFTPPNSEHDMDDDDDLLDDDF